MPPIKLTEVLSFSSEDPNNPADNLLKAELNKRWKCAPGCEKQASVTLKFDRLTSINSVDIGNNGSAFVEVLVAREDTDFKVLLVASSFMTPIESRNESDPNRVRMFGSDKLNKQVSGEKWDRVKVICTQPFNKKMQFGLSFITMSSSNESSGDTSKAIKLGCFTLKEDDGADSIAVGSMFAKRKEREESPLRGAAAIRAASAAAVTTSPTSASVKRKAPDNPPDTGFYQLKKKQLTEKDSERSPSRYDHQNQSSPSAQHDSDQKKDKQREKGEGKREKDREKGERKRDKDREKGGDSRKEKKERTDAGTNGRDRKEDKHKRNSTGGDKGDRRGDRDDKRDRRGDRDDNRDRRGDRDDNRDRRADRDDNRDRRADRDDNGDRRGDRDKPSTSARAPIPSTKKKTKSAPFAKLMGDVVFVMSGYQNPQRSQLRDQMLDMGAKYKSDWDPSCTHLICAFTNTPKFQQVKGKGKIVVAKWITQCHNHQIRYPWRRYQLEKNRNQDESEEEIWAEELLTKDQPSSPIGSGAECGGDSGSDNEDTDDEIERILAKDKEKKKKKKKKEKENDENEPKEQTKVIKQEEPRTTEATPRRTKESSDPPIKKEIMNGEKREKEQEDRPIKPTIKKEEAEEMNGSLEDDGIYDADTDVDEENKKYLEPPDTSSLELPPLGQFFKGINFFLYGKMEENHKKMILRYIIAFHGVVEDYMNDNVRFVITNDEWDDNFDNALEDNPSLQFVKPSWVWKCCDKEKLVPPQPHLVVPRESE